MYTYTSVLLLGSAPIQSLPFQDTALSNIFSLGTSFVDTEDIYFGCVYNGLDNIFKAKCKWFQDYIDVGRTNDQCIFLRNNATDGQVDDFLSSLGEECGYQGNNFRSLEGNPGPASIYDKLQGYGCWCSTATSFASGHGPVQNSLDQACKDITEANKCLQLDISEEDCPNDFSDYWVANPVTSLTFMSVEQQCVFMNNAINNSPMTNINWSDNQLECAQKKCIIQARMVMFLVRLGLDENHQFDNSFTHDEYNGEFNHKDNCVFNDGDKPKLNEPQCCGQFPERYPIYKEHQGCCSGTRYNKLKLECCDEDIGALFSLVPPMTCVGNVIDDPF